MGQRVLIAALKLKNASKLHTIRCAGYNLGLLMRKAYGLGKLRSWETGRAGGFLAVLALAMLTAAISRGATAPSVVLWSAVAMTGFICITFRCQKNHHFLTGC